MESNGFQRGMGQTGRFGEIFVFLGVLILVGGILLALAVPQLVHTSDAKTGDALISGLLFAVEGVGFVGFGIVAMLSGWGRHHPEFDEA